MIVNRFSVLRKKKEQCDSRRWLLAQISQATGVRLETLLLYASGEVKCFDSRTIIPICRFFECDVGDLLTRVEDGGQGLRHKAPARQRR